MNNFGLGVSYSVYAVFGLMAFIFVLVYVNETKGKTLEEISLQEELFEVKELNENLEVISNKKKTVA